MLFTVFHYKMQRFYLFIFLVFVLQIFYVIAEKNESEFVPTHEWQPVKKGQPIPKGLHIRHNLQSGLTEAKLLDKDDEKSQNSNDNDNDNNINNNDDDDNVDNNNDNKIKSLTVHADAVKNDESDIKTVDTQGDNKMKIFMEELKARLKKIKFETTDNLGVTEKNSDDKSKKFRTYDELKEELMKLEINVTTDSEILVNLFERFEAYAKPLSSGTLQNSQIESIIQLFNDLEFLLHQIDNAQLFAEMGGMSKIISPCLNTTNDNIKIEALRILGTAVQSNPQVQAKALNNDLVPKLLHLLTTSNKATLRSRCLFALSALLRQFPASQKAFIDHGGLEIFGKILENGPLQTQLRIMKLITDLAVERENINKTEDEGLRLRKIREYGKTNFEEKLMLHKYCKYLASILRQNFNKNIAVNSLIELSDFYEVITDNMLILLSTCKDEYRNNENGLFDVLNEIFEYYDKIKLAELLNEVEIFQYIVEQLLKLKKLTFDDVHDEL